MYGKPDSNHIHWIMKVRLIASGVAVQTKNCLHAVPEMEASLVVF